MSAISYAQRRVLENAEAGRSLTYHLSGRSAMGGFTSTFSSLRRQGLIDVEHRLTPAGAEALKKDRS